MNKKWILGKKKLAQTNAPSLRAKALLRYKQSGFIGLLWIIVKRLTQRKNILFYYIYSIDIDALKKNDTNKFEYRISASLPEEKQLDEICCSRQLFERRLSSNHFYAMAFDGQKPIGWLWAHEGDKHYEQQYGFNVAFRQNEIFYYDSNTRLSWRKRGVLKGMLTALAKNIDESKHGKEKIVAIIEAGNLDSQSAHERIGFSKDSLHVYFRIGQRKVSIRLL